MMDSISTRISLIVEKVLAERNGIDEPFDEYLSQVVERCFKEGLNKVDTEFCLQEMFGDDLHFTELFRDVWEECKLESTDGSSPVSDSESALTKTPLISEHVYTCLPEILKAGCGAFEDHRQRDTFLISSLSVIASVLDNVSGLYFNEKFSPVLYSFITAPAASGKSAMKYAAKLIEPIHKIIREESEQTFKEYRLEKRAYDRKGRDTKVDPGEPPEEPQYRVHIIPGNASSASVISHLEANNGSGLIVETEADSLSKSFASEWGDFSDMLRKGFQHEAIRSSRKTNGEYKEVERPCFSICLTGTPAQVLKLVQSAENGMFSRIMFYAFSSPNVWIDPSPKKGRVSHNELFDGLAEQLKDVYHFYRQDEFQFELQDAHWELLNARFEEMLGSTIAVFGDETGSIVKRLGLICFRIAMVLSALEHFETQRLQRSIVCSNEAFTAALSISTVILDHSLLVFDRLPKSSKSGFDEPDSREKFFQNLPQEFRRSDAQRIAKEFQVGNERTVDALLKLWHKKKRLEKPKTGLYVKTNS